MDAGGLPALGNGRGSLLSAFVLGTGLDLAKGAALFGLLVPPWGFWEVLSGTRGEASRCCACFGFKLLLLVVSVLSRWWLAAS